MTGVQTCALPICFPVTIREEEYSKLAKEVRGDNIKQYGEVQGDIDNEIAAKAIRYWSESIRHKHGKHPNIVTGKRDRKSTHSRCDCHRFRQRYNIKIVEIRNC